MSIYLKPTWWTWVDFCRSYGTLPILWRPELSAKTATCDKLLKLACVNGPSECMKDTFLARSERKHYIPTAFRGPKAGLRRVRRRKSAGEKPLDKARAKKISSRRRPRLWRPQSWAVLRGSLAMIEVFKRVSVWASKNVQQLRSSKVPYFLYCFEEKHNGITCRSVILVSSC